jgi:CubicO group peptidase (beta-lactamase class C family)
MAVIKKFSIVIIILFTLPVLFTSCTHENNKNTKQGENTGIISAKPEDVASNVSLERYMEIINHFNNPANKVKMQFASKESQFAWQNMSLFFRTAQVQRSGPVYDLPYNIQKSIGSVKYQNSKGETYTTDEHFNKFPIDGMIVIKKGAVVYERYKTMRPDDKHIWYSVSKVIGATIMTMLEEEGKVDVNNPVTFYLPELKGTVWDEVKVVEALDMATGLNGTEFDEPDGESTTNPERIWYQWAVSVGLLPGTGANTSKWHEVLGKMIRIKPAYDVFAYNSISTFVVDRIVERVAKKPLTVLMAERIWSKMGMEHDGYMVVSPEGICMGSGFMNSTLRDLAKFGMIYTPSHGKVSGETIVSAGMLKKMQNMEHSSMYGNGSVGKYYRSVFPDQKVLANRYQWDAVFQDGDLFKSGVGGQGLYVSPANDIVIAWFCTGSGDNQEETLARNIVNSLK